MPQLEIETVGSITIYVNDKGKFFAEVGGEIVTRASLNALKRLIAQRTDPLRVMIPRREGAWRITEDMIIRVVGDNLKGEGSSYGRYSSDQVYIYDEAAMEKLKGLLAEYEALRTKWDAVLKGLIRVTPRNFEDLREQLSSSEKRT